MKEKKGRWLSLLHETKFGKLSKYSLFLWVFSILVVVGMSYIKTENQFEENISVFVFVVDIIVGILSFCFMVLFKMLDVWSPKVVGIIIGLLVVGGVGLVSANFNELFVSEKQEVTPTAAIISPTTIPALAQEVIKESTIAKKSIETANAVGGSFECVGPDGKIFKTSESECKKLNESWGKPMDYMVNCTVSNTCGGGTRYLKKSECNKSVCCQVGSGWYFYSSIEKCRQDQASGKPSNQYNYARPTIQPWDGKISCSYSGGGYSYDFGKLTYADCMTRMDQYWNQQSSKSLTTAPTAVVVSQSVIDSCKSAVRSEVNSLVNGCYVKFQGSAAESCEQTYRDRGATQTQNCISYGTHTILTDTIQVPTQKCYSTWEEYYNAHPVYGGQYNYQYPAGTPPCD
ncbi:MAG TPA: hypothetical protein VLH94_02690 [Spirochaetia bacterium]|nr:hypothetical protein [Spirochaetia bacterium]